VRVLVPGGCGFLGSDFVRRLAAAGEEVVVLDRLTDFGNLARLEGAPHEFVQGDVADAVTATGAADGCQAIVNFAAETNLDASALASGGFIVTDVFGTHVLLEFARVAGIRYVQVSTKEADEPRTSPAASKAGADLQALAYAEAGAHVSVTRGVRAYGPFQHPAAEPAAAIVATLDADRDSVESLPGAWVHVDDHSAAVELVLREGAPGEIYRIGEDDEPVRALGWGPQHELSAGLAETAEWYRTHRDWWESLTGGARSFEDQYARRGD
jgi:dTDP-glucose 4,6-dehydratase